jgi:uncharacterized repeat protein (TIGR03803 family)
MKNFGFRTGCIVAALCAVFCLATTIAAQAQTETPLGTVTGNPYGGALVQGTNGNFFGTTLYGGIYKLKYGNVFEVTPSGTLSNVYSFCREAHVCPDGETPYGGLMVAANGSLYGTTSYGGANSGGTVFEISPGDKFSTLYNVPYLEASYAGLVQGFNGDLYGSAGDFIFSINSAGTETTIYTFCSLPNCADGTGAGMLTLGANGDLYGITGDGGAYKHGTFFKLTPAGVLITLHNFTAVEGEGSNGLVLASNGNFYGTSGFGGANNAGTVYELTPAGHITILHNFCSAANCADGNRPSSALIEGTDGNLYGTTPLGGTGGLGSCASYCGTAYQITTSGTLTTLYNFCSLPNCTDGLAPYYGLVQGTDGNFYGAGYDGTIFKLSTGLGPLVRSNPVFGRAGYSISILGSDLTGTTAVTFNGVAATFSVVSATQIKATVPAGATSGTIEVTTPGGVLSSNVAFQILP